MTDFISKSVALKTTIWSLIFLRLAIGHKFITIGYGKYPRSLAAGNLGTRLSEYLKDMPADWYPWYHNLMVNTIIPNADILGYIVTFGEIAAGLGLILGFMARPALLATIFMNLNYHFATGYRTGPSGWVNVFFVCAELSLIFIPVGRSFGLDYFLNKKFPKVKFLF